jgi:hypothetical protein
LTFFYFLPLRSGRGGQGPADFRDHLADRRKRGVADEAHTLGQLGFRPWPHVQEGVGLLRVELRIDLVDLGEEDQVGFFGFLDEADWCAEDVLHCVAKKACRANIDADRIECSHGYGCFCRVENVGKGLDCYRVNNSTFILTSQLSYAILAKLYKLFERSVKVSSYSQKRPKNRASLAVATELVVNANIGPTVSNRARIATTSPLLQIMIKYCASLNWNEPHTRNQLEHKLREVTSHSEKSQADSKEQLKAAILALVDEVLSREDTITTWIKTEHGFSVPDEAELKNVPPLKPGWKVALFIESADWGDGHEDPVIGRFYVAMPTEAKFDWPGADREVNVKDYPTLTVCFYRKRQVIKLPEDSFIYLDGEWQPVSQID